MPILVVQRGHCYRRTGATGTNGEQAYATAVANACLNLLHGRGGWQVRAILADDPALLYRGDAMVSIHCDGSTNPNARGASIGYRTAEGQRFGQAWKRAYAARGWPGFRPDNYTSALAGYYGTGTAVAQGNRRAFIAECGFLTNPQDRDLLIADGGPVRVALAIGDALGIKQPLPEEDEDVKPFQNLMLAREAKGAPNSSWPAVYVGNGIIRRHVASETDLENLQYRIQQAGGNPTVAEGWEPGSLAGVLGVLVKEGN